MTEKTQGTERCTQTYAVVGAPEQPVSDAARGYGPVVGQQGGEQPTATFAAGRTISLGNYEFVRILIGAKMSVPEPGPTDAAFGAVEAFVNEILAREEALVRKKIRPNQPLPALVGTNRAVWVEYGLTLNAGIKFESHKVDIGFSRPIGDAEDAEAAMGELEADLAERVATKRDQLRGRE